MKLSCYSCLQGFDIYKCVPCSLLYRVYVPQVILIRGKLHQVFKKVCVKRHDHRVEAQIWPFNTIVFWWLGLQIPKKSIPYSLANTDRGSISSCKIFGYQEENIKQQSCSWFHCQMQSSICVIRLPGHLTHSKFLSMLLCPGSTVSKAGRGRVLGCHTTEESRWVLIITNIFVSAPHHSLDKYSALSLREPQIRGMTRNRNNTKDSNLKQE